MKGLNEYDKGWCGKLLTELFRRPISVPFRVPVDPKLDMCEDYLKIIKKPMDFSTIRSKLSDNKYKSFKDFVSDMLLVFSNAKQYNEEGTLIYMMADVLEEYVQGELKNKADSWDSEWNNYIRDVTKRIREHLLKAPNLNLYRNIGGSLGSFKALNPFESEKPN